VHPTTRLVVWLLLLLASQCLDGEQLLAALLVLPFLGPAALRRALRLAWRTRWLFLSLFVIVAWGAAGEPAWGGALAPTREGLLAAATHGGRLLLALSAVAVLVEWMPVPELLVATHRLLQPLRRCGVDPDRSVVRLLLVMRHIETLPRPRDWRILLKAPNTGGEGEVFELADRPFSWSDPALILLVAGVVGAFLLRQA
jgi:energy-coupling factor transporter transmembrane protein EcfT